MIQIKKLDSYPVLKGAVEWLVTIGLAALLFFVVRGFLFRTAHVDGNSMAPAIEHGDMLFLNRLVYRFSSPKVGDIIAFPYAENPSDFFIKRVIATPGDTVDLKEGFFFVNGEKLDDDFSSEPTISMGNISFPITIGDNHYFVLGDNRNGSQDSRFSEVGTIYENDIVGRASICIWPLNRVGSVK